MKLPILLICFFITWFSFSQTKIIAHKSHSGSSNTFQMAYSKAHVSIENSNFGLPGASPIVVLDSVIAVSDSLTVLKIRRTVKCFSFVTEVADINENDFAVFSDSLVNSDALDKSLTKQEIIEDDEFLFFRFKNKSIESVVFIGFKE